jgi:hypothetical protein
LSTGGGVVTIGVSVVVAFCLASIAEYVAHRTLFTTIAGAIGGWSGQRFARSLVGILLDRDDKWLSRLEFEQVYQMHLAFSNFILLFAIACGSAIGFSISYYFNTRTKVPVVYEREVTTNE